MATFNVGNTGIGAGNSVRIFPLTGDTPAITANQAPTIVFGKIEKSSYTGSPSTGSVEVTLDHLRNDSAFGKFLKTYLSADSTAEEVVVNFENGDKESSTSAGADPELYAICDLHIAGGERLCYQGPVKITGDTGNIETGANAFTRRPITMTFVKATKAITLPNPAIANAVDSTFYPVNTYTLPQEEGSNMPASITHAVGTACVEVWLPKGTNDK